MAAAKIIALLFLRLYLFFIGLLFLGIAVLMLNNLVFGAEEVFSHYRIFRSMALPAVIALFSALLLLMLGLPWGRRNASKNKY
jgi:hypothetical protein